MEKQIIYFAGYKGHRSNKFEIIKEYFTSYDCIQFDQTLEFKNSDLRGFKNLIGLKSG